MPRTLFAAALLLAACAAALAASCNASVTESCLAGPCATPGMGAGGMGAGGMATGGMGAGGDPDACTSIDTASSPRTGDYPCDIFAIVHNNCHRCHQQPQKNGAPFPLLNYADTQQVYLPAGPAGPQKLVFQQMYDQTRVGAVPRMPLGGHLKDPDFKALTNWLIMCAPPVPTGSGCGCPSPQDPQSTSKNCCPGDGCPDGGSPGDAGSD
jgi:hypothetical protein